MRGEEGEELLKRLIPDFIFELPLQHRTVILVGGSILLVIGSYLFAQESFLKGAVFIVAGILVEWIIVASVYYTTKELEEEIDKTYSKMKDSEKDIAEMQEDVKKTGMKLQGIAKETFDKKERMEMFDNFEQVGHPNPEDVDFESYQEPIENRLRQAERRIDDLEHEVR